MKEGERNSTSTKGRPRWKSSSENYLLIAEVRFRLRIRVRISIWVRDSKTIFHENYLWWMSNCVFLERKRKYQHMRSVKYYCGFQAVARRDFFSCNFLLSKIKKGLALLKHFQICFIQRDTLENNLVYMLIFGLYQWIEYIHNKWFKFTSSCSYTQFTSNTDLQAQYLPLKIRKFLLFLAYKKAINQQFGQTSCWYWSGYSDTEYLGPVSCTFPSCIDLLWYLVVLFKWLCFA